MSLLQNAFGNSSSSMLSAKIMGSLIFIQLPPFAGWGAWIGDDRSFRRQRTDSGGWSAVGFLFFWSAPPVDHIFAGRSLWIYGCGPDGLSGIDSWFVGR